MDLTDEEILELDRLLLEQGLYDFDKDTNPNYKFIYKAIKEQKFNKNGEVISGFRGAILEGSSRSGKTWSGIDIIIYICLFLETNCTINIYRQTYNEFKTTLYDDFKRRLDDFQLPNKFHTAEEIKSFKIRENKIYFIGCDKASKAHGGGSDYAFFNEMIHIDNDFFDQVEMRCRKFWWGDYNPSVTSHWIFDKILKRPDIGYLRTTFKVNSKISIQERNKILSYEPWKPDSYEVIDNELIYKEKPITSKNCPPPHPKNIDNGTADEFMWKVYGLGLRGAMKGLLFPNVTWIDEFPDNLSHTYGLDFGFTADPSSLVKHAETSTSIYLEPLVYECTDTPETLEAFFEAFGVERNIRITADSSDKYTGENKGTVEMVKSLKAMGYNIVKVKKTKSVMFWLTSMKQKKIYIVKNHLYSKIKKEQENYKLREINGISINQPIDEFNHFWDSGRYAHMASNSNNIKVHKTSQEVLKSINY